MSAESILSSLASGRASTRLSTQLSRAAIVIFAVIALGAIVGLSWSTRQSDEVSVERQVRVAKHSINIALDELALQQETVAIWDNSAEQMTGKVPDQQWLFDNIGLWLHRIFRHDEVYLVDGYDRPVQSV